MSEFLISNGLWAVALGAFFESQWLLLGAGFLASANIFNSTELAIVSFLGAFVGHIFWFALGRICRSRRSQLVPGKWRNPIIRINDSICTRPWTSIFLFQYLYGTRLISSIAFGFAPLNFSWFCKAQAANCLFWVIAIESIGFSIGGIYQFTASDQLIFHLLGIFITSAFLVYAYCRIYKKPAIWDIN